MKSLQMLLVMLVAFLLLSVGNPMLFAAEQEATEQEATGQEASEDVFVLQRADGVIEIETDEDVLEVDLSGVEVSVDTVIEVEMSEEKPCEKKKCDKKGEKPCASKDKAVAKKARKAGESSFLSMFFGSADEKPSIDPSKFPATHRQVALLKVGGENSQTSGLSVQSFCLDGEDNLLVAITDQSGGKLQVIDASGELKNTLDLPVIPEAVNVDTQGNYLVAGQGKLLRLDPQGEVLTEGVSPLITQLEENREEIRQQVIQQIKDQAKMMSQQRVIYQNEIDSIYARAAKKLDSRDHKEYKVLKERLDKLTDEQEAKLSDDELNAMALRKILFRMLDTKVKAAVTEQDQELLDIYVQQMEYFKGYKDVEAGAEPSDKQVDETLASMIEYKSKVASISATDKEVFIATGAVAGYGFDVWKFDAKMENPEKIVTQLRGCCGQMDVQACEGGLYVAENSRHKVQHFDLAGKKVNSWGSGNREGVEGFSSCCNPMNVAFGPDGSVYTAESGNGRIKRYSAEGELMEHIGSVELVPGCKKVSIAVTKDQQRVYMLDITRNHIIVMEAKPDKPQVASNDTPENAS